jgi:transposase
MTSKHKSEDYKLSAVEYYLVGDKSQLEVCKIFKCSPRSLMRWVGKYEKEGEIKRENQLHIKFIKNTLNFYWMKSIKIKLLL